MSPAPKKRTSAKKSARKRPRKVNKPRGSYTSPFQQNAKSILKKVVKYTALASAAGFLLFCSVYFFRALTFNMDEVAIMPERTKILDRNGLELGAIHGQNRTVVPYDEISPNFLQSIIAREDARFFEHCGIDLKGLIRATVRNIKDRGMTQGASTITMQLSRNTFDLSQGNKWYNELDRKFLEIFVTMRIERSYEKTEILEHYCNRIFWGHSMLGIEAASQAYLEKPAKDLTLSEGAMLAGIVRGPNAFSPFRSLKLATRERDTVLDRLVFYSYITQAEADKAKAEPLKIRPKSQRTRGQSYAMDAISRELEYHLGKNNIKIGGLTIHTTIDKGLQTIAERSVNSRLASIERLSSYHHQTRSQFQKSGSKKAPSYIQGALVCLDNKTGGIVATVGGRSADESRFNRAYYARRQVGSLFKPFVYQAAFDRGLRPRTLIDDSPLRDGEIKHSSSKWKPNNSDGKFLGLIETKEALMRSRNTSSIRVGNYAGLSYVQKAAELAGFELFQWNKRQEGKTPDTATAYLGAWEATPEEVARAYSIFPNLGTYRQPYVIAKIVDRNGETLYDITEKGGVEIAETPLSQGATYEVSKVLEETNIRGTGSSLRSTYGFTAPSAGKTGTTDDYKDAWYAGYTSELTCAVWVGMDSPKRTITKGYGSRLAMPIWADLMKAAAVKTEFKPQSLKKDLPSTTVTLCQRSARHATSQCAKDGYAYEDLVPNDLLYTINDTCPLHPTRQSSQPSRTVNTSLGGFLGRIFGSKNKSNSPPPQRAIVVDESLPPQRAIVVDESLPIEETIDLPPVAIIVEEPTSLPPKAIIVE